MNENVKSSDKPRQKKQEKVQIIYVDPNTDLDFNEGVNDSKSVFEPGRGKGGKLMIPPEDLALYVNLRVETMSSIKWGGDKKNIEVATVINQAQSIPSASSDYTIANVRYLTTDYLDYGWETATSGVGFGQPESLGIKSINIEYKSWYVPEIKITFIDIMGLATFSPMQSQMEKEDRGEVSAVKSLFKAFYSIPYSRFSLTIKGYFGSPVTYYLQCSNVHSEVNTTTGNVHINVAFIGYRWGKYADVLAQWVFLSPYLTAPFNMNEEWNQKYSHKASISNSDVENFKEGSMPDYLTMRKIINSAVDNIRKLSESDNLATSKREFISFKEAYETLLKSIENLKSKIEQNPFDSLIRDNIIINKKDIVKVDSFEEHIKTTPQNIVFKADGWITTEHDSGYGNICNNLLKNIISENVKNYNAEVEILRESKWDNISTIDTLFETAKFIPYYFEEKEGEKTTKIVYEIGLLINTITKNYENVREEIKDRDKELKEILYDRALEVVNNMKFKPTMFNVIKWLFSHYLHFIESFVLVSSSKEGDELRMKIKRDSGVVNEKSVVHPWFYMRECDPKNGHIVTYPHHKEYGKLPEVQYTNAIHVAIGDIQKQLAADKAEEEANKKSATVDNVDMSVYKWKPIFAHDISYRLEHTAIDEINPYKTILKNYQLMDAICNIGILSVMRMFASIGTRYGSNIDKNKISIYAIADAENIFDAIKSQTKLCERIKDNLQTGDFYNFLRLLVSPKEGDWKESGSKFLYDLINIDNKLLINDEIFRCGHKVTIDKTEFFQLNTWLVEYNNIFFPMLPLSALTFSEMLQKWAKSGFKVWGNEYPQLFSGDKTSLELLYPSLDINIVKSSFNIVDFDPKTIKNLDELYNQYNNDNLVDTWFNADGDISKNNIEQCFIDEKYIINKNIDPGENELSLSFIKGNTVNSITKQTESYLTIVGTTSSPIKNNKELIESLLKLKSNLQTLINEKNDCMILRDFVQRLRNGEIQNQCIAIPHLNTIEKEKGLFYETYKVNGDALSIFSYSSYYGINEDKEENRNYYKAFLLLQSLGVNIIQLDKITDESKYHESTLIRLPKILALNIGAILYMKEYYQDKEKSKSLLLDEAFGNIKDKTEKIGNLSKDVKIVFIDYFKTWANWANGKNGIIEELEYGVFKSDNFSVSYDKKRLKQPLPTTSFPAYNKGVSVITGSKNGHVQLFLDPTNKSVQKLMSLYVDDVLILNSRYGLSKEKRDSYIRISTENVQAYIKSLNDKLLKLLGEMEKKTIDDLDETTITTRKNILIQGYYDQFKYLHDRWFLDVKEVGNLDFIEQEVERMMSKVMIVDQYFSDISDDLFVNLDYLSSLLDRAFEDTALTDGTKKGNLNFLSILSEITSKSDCLMLPMPTLGFFSGVNQNDAEEFLKYLFKPQIYSEIVPNPEEDFGIIIMRVPKPSETPTTDPYSSEESDCENTAANFGPEEKMRMLNKGKEIMSNNNIPVRAFGVSFGRENESFFNIRKLDTTKPQVTEQSIKMMVRLVKGANEQGERKSYAGEDLYSSFSKMAYFVTVDIKGGSAPIFPLMYFQLNNVFLFTGGYIITKVNHSISENYMTTTFEGVKQDFHKQPLVEIPFINALIGEVKPTEGIDLSSSSNLTENQRKTVSNKTREYDPNWKIQNILLMPGHSEDYPSEGRGKESPIWNEIDGFIKSLKGNYKRYYNESFKTYVKDTEMTHQRFREFAYNRLICRLVEERLKGINVIYVPQDKYATANKYDKEKTLLVIIHGNAADSKSTKNPEDRGWTDASGWEVFTSVGDGQSINYGGQFCTEAAELLDSEGVKHRFAIRNPRPKQHNLYELSQTEHPAVLTENLFFNNKTDLKFLLSDEGIETIVNIHVEAIKKICRVS